MSPNQKRAWGNVIIWGSLLIALAVFFAITGTVFFWLQDYTRTIFYTITGIAIAAWLLMMLVVWINTSKVGVTTDERDIEIMNRVNSAAGPIAMTAVAITSLVLMIVYLEDKTSVMSPYFLFYIMLTNIVVYWLAQGINTLVSYRRS